MASSLIVPIAILENIRPHSNADKLELCNILGYQMCIPKGKYQEGEKVIYIPADSVIPPEWAEKWGIVSFLKGKDKNRVGRVCLRGEPSFGVVISIDWLDTNLEIGDNVADIFGITKYQPPIKTTAGDAAKYNEKIDPYFQKYTDIENGRIFVDVFKPGEEVVASEKIHGTNSRCGLIWVDDIWVYVAGSMEVRRKRPTKKINGNEIECDFSDPEMSQNIYWYPLSKDCVRNLLDSLIKNAKNSVLIYGEIFGAKIQNLCYGIKSGIDFRAFDICVDGKYLDWANFENICDQHQVHKVPILYWGPFDVQKIKEIADGDSTIPNATNIREGVVVKPLQERIDEKIGRAILKFIGTQYELLKKDRDDNKDI